MSNSHVPMRAPRSAQALRRPSARMLRLVLILAVVLGPLLAAEGLVRALVALDRLPVASAPSRSFEITWTNLHRGRPPDVLFLGDSAAQQDMDPATLAQALGAQMGRPVAVFDAGVPGSTIQLSLALVRQLEREHLLPRVVILGIQPGWLKGKGTFFNQFFLKAPAGRIVTDCQFEHAYDAVVNCRAEEVSYLWRWRGRLTAIGRAIVHPLQRTAGSPDLQLRADGFAAGSSSTDVGLQRDLDLMRQRGGLGPFRLGTETVSDFVNLVDYLRGQGVTVLAVSIPNIPPLAARLETIHPGWQRAYDLALDQIAMAARVAIVRPGIARWFTAADAHNPKHLSAQGAVKFTRELWAIPWFERQLAIVFRGA